MGLTIHYSGKITSVSMIDELVGEVIAICKAVKWKYELVNFPEEKVKGILFSPKMCEPICLSFCVDGRLCSPLPLLHKKSYPDTTLDPSPSYTCHPKTHYAGVYVHMAIIKLLRYITEKYFESFSMNDETRYWETNDEEVALQRFGYNNQVLDTMAKTLSVRKTRSEKSTVTIVNQVEALLNERRK